MERDEMPRVLERARQLDDESSPKANARFLAEMDEAASQMQQVQLQETSELPVAFSAAWPDDATQ